MFSKQNEAIHEFALGEGLLPTSELGALHRQAEEDGISLADALVQRGIIGKGELLSRLASQVGQEFLANLPASLPADITSELSPGLAHRFGVVPWRSEGARFELLNSNPFNLDTQDELTFALGREVRLLVADPDGVDRLVSQYYGEKASGKPPVDELDIPADSADSEAMSGQDLETLATQAPVVRFVEDALGQAVRAKASDIHFEPFESQFNVRYRVDGVLSEMPTAPRRLALPAISRLKVLANLNITERRLPQDGRIAFVCDGHSVDLRVSTLPTQFGESVVLRVLDRSAIQLDLGQLGLPTAILAGVQEVIKRPNGMFIVTGPTGSGKTTTLYSALREINTPDRKILTAEDPVEYETAGIMQVAVNPVAGLTFALALRSFLRQDPDAIMVGEIRDLETAQVAVQASLTGHVVFSTLHTNDAAGAATRLIDLGIEPFLVASALEGVLAQRLVRRICRHCREPFRPSEELLGSLRLAGPSVRDRLVYHGCGCEHCAQTGYHGRMGIFEWLPLTEAIRELVTTKASRLAIRDQAVAEGMRTLREDGLRAVFQGETTLEELARCT